MHIKIRLFLNLWLGLTRYRRTSTYTMLHYREWYHMAKENPTGSVAYCVYMRVQLAWVCLNGLVGLSWKHAFSNSALDIWSFPCAWHLKYICPSPKHSSDYVRSITFNEILANIDIETEYRIDGKWCCCFYFEWLNWETERKNACLSYESLLRMSSLEDC